MMGRFGQMVLQPIGKQRLKRLRCAFVQQPAALGEHRVVSDLQGQGMLESVFDIAHHGLFVDELSELQRRQHPLQFVI